ncbi:MAG TPA: amidohydrolase family protein, partial [Terriglobales bacterium]|nr:amidohydrolase family protein [Terriglobales bacterium]
MNQGPRAFRMGLRGMAAEAEWKLVRRDIQLARETGAHLHVAHISTAAAIAAVREARQRGIHVTGEATPHHFAMIDDDINDYDANFKMNPPLRSRQDRDAVIAGLLEGTIDAIATDHAPHALYEKRQEFDRAPFGIIGLETALGLAFRILHAERGMALPQVVRLLTTGPASVLANTAVGARGSLRVGSPADIAIFDPAARWKFDASKSKSKSRNTPFDGWELHGRVTATLVGGRWVFRD